jgi:hypothetical protein
MEEELFNDFEKNDYADEADDIDDMSEITEEDLLDEMEDSDFDDDDNNEDMDFETIFKFSANKHKLEGKHSLKRDTIFNGKLDDELEEESHNSDDFNLSLAKIDTTTVFEYESRHNDEYLNDKNLSKDVFSILQGYTNLNFKVNRRKPNKQDFNNYYCMLLDKLEKKYSRAEIFIELATYFTDNYYNVFKLLEPKYTTNIIKELKDKGYLKDLNNINFI